MTGAFRVGRGSLRTAARAAGARAVALLAVVLALFVAISGATSAMAATAIIIGGLGATQLSDSFMKQALGGKFVGTDPVSGTTWQREDVTWPAQAGPILGKIPMGQSVSVGTQNMLNMIKTTYAQTGGAITVFGMSEGSAVVDEVMRALKSDPTAPPPSAINFIVAGDANHRQAGFIPHTYGGYKFQKPAPTPYNLTVVTYQYDGWSDWPDNLWNGLAARNALAGAVLLHNKTYFVDLSTVPAKDITVKQNASGGTTTYYLIETPTLPLVMMNPRLAPREAELKAKIDAAYSRNNTPKTTAATQAALPQASAAVTPGDAAETPASGSASPASEVADHVTTNPSRSGSGASSATDATEEASSDSDGKSSTPRTPWRLRDKPARLSGVNASDGPVRKWVKARQDRAAAAASARDASHTSDRGSE